MLAYDSRVAREMNTRRQRCGAVVHYLEFESIALRTMAFSARFI